MFSSQSFTISYVGKDIAHSNAREITMNENVKHTTIIVMYEQSCSLFILDRWGAIIMTFIEIKFNDRNFQCWKY